MDAPDGGFAEWRERHWLPRVYDGVKYGNEVRMAPSGAGGAPGAAAPTAGSKGYKPLADEGGAKGKPSKGGHRSPRDGDRFPSKTKPGAYFADGTALADGEYVWMPYEKARRHRHQNNDRDVGLWVALALFVAYFVFKIVPTVFMHHYSEFQEASAEGARRMLSSAAAGDTLTADMVQEMQKLIELAANAAATGRGRH